MGKIYKAAALSGSVSLAVAETTDVVDEAIKIHKLSPVCAAALGRTLTAAAYMATSLKGENERLSITIDGGGPCGKIIASVDSDLNVRGSIDVPSLYLPPRSDGKLDVGGAVGKKGKITVVKNLGLKEPYVGRCNLVSGEIAEDFTAYYAYSEQQPTAMALGVLIGADGRCKGAGGIVIQPLPDCSEENIAEAENLIRRFENISYIISEKGAKGIIDEYFNELDFEEYSPVYKCNCSKKYIDGVLITIGKKELLETVDSEGKVEVCCQFCNKKYVYGEKDVLRLFDEK